MWLVNQHGRPVFACPRNRSHARPDPIYAVDENWAAVHPHGSTAPAGGPVELELRIMNHTPKAEQYRVRWNLPPGWRVVRGEDRATAPARGEASARVTIVVTGRREVRRPGVARVERGVGPDVRRRPVNSSLSATPAASLDG